MSYQILSYIVHVFLTYCVDIARFAHVLLGSALYLLGSFVEQNALHFCEDQLNKQLLFPEELSMTANPLRGLRLTSTGFTRRLSTHKNCGSKSNGSEPDEEWLKRKLLTRGEASRSDEKRKWLRCSDDQKKGWRIDR